MHNSFCNGEITIREFIVTNFVGVTSSLGSVIFLLGLWLLYKAARKRVIEKRKQKFFKENGGLLLQQRMLSNEANVDKAILFSLNDLEKATDHFNMNRVLGKGGQGTVYKGMLVDGTIVAVKSLRWKEMLKNSSMSLSFFHKLTIEMW